MNVVVLDECVDLGSFSMNAWISVSINVNSSQEKAEEIQKALKALRVRWAPAQHPPPSFMDSGNKGQGAQRPYF